ncbi:MAG: SixA phosphatase family protein [Flavobacteriales bacterium]
MKTIYFIRHAKSSWSFPQLNDLERPLNKRGYQSASLIGHWMKEKGVILDAMITSPSVRTLSTTQIIATHIKFPIHKIEIKDSFYEFSGYGDPFFRYLKTLPSNITKVAVFGHNSTFENMAHKISNGFVDRVPTCGVCVSTYNQDSWENIAIDHIEFVDFVAPKMLE